MKTEPYVPFVSSDAAALREEFDRECAAAAADPIEFWRAQAQVLEWAQPFTRVLDESKAPFYRWYEDGKLNIVASAVDRHANGALRNKVAYIWLSEDCRTRIEVTYGELAVRVARAANALRSMGVKRGDAVILYLPLTLEAVAAMLACARLGAVHSVVYAGLAASSLQARVEDAKATAIVTADYTYRRGKPIALAPTVEQALTAGCHTVRHVAVWRRQSETTIPTVADGRKRYDWSELLERAVTEAPIEIVDAEHPLFILYTSGTTGKPKGVLHVHGGYGVGISHLMRRYWGVRENEVFWCASDIGWIVGHSYIVYAPLICGLTTVFREGAPDYPDTAVIYDIIERERVNVIFTAPTTVRFLMKFGDEPAAKHDLCSLRWLTCAGEPLNPEAYHWARRVLCGNGAWGNIAENWWQTETGGPQLGTPPGYPVKPGAVGIPMPGVSATVVDEELYLTRPFPHLFRTVYGDDARFKAAWTEHGYRTGDAALRDADGYFRVVGRIDDVMNIAGHRIGSAEVEHALVQHPLVAEAAAFGLPDELKGERLVCHVTLRAGAQAPADPTAFFGEHVRTTMGAIATPSEVHVVAALPKTRSGKIMRRLLRARAMGQPEGDISTLDA